jgi:rare lipoprotein A
MKEKIWFGLRATVLVAMLSTAPSTQAQQEIGHDKAQHHANATTSTNAQPTVTVPEQSQDAVAKATSETPSGAESSASVVKIGTRSATPSEAATEAIIAKTQVHTWAGRPATTLYVRNLPVLTFLGNSTAAPATVKVGVTAPPASKESTAIANQSAIAGQKTTQPSVASSSEADDPASLATRVAAQINQLAQPGTPVGDITVHWTGKGDQARYEIRVAGKPLVTLDKNVLLAGQRTQSEVGVLQATNRLRRLIANAAPLTTIAGKPKAQTVLGDQQIALGSVRFSVNGYASWYGPGFHGNLTANGERYNQYGLTAAHKTLPFGTIVRVTNKDNGRSVVVRITDRGPYVEDRVIDLSMGAAQTIGLINSGVAPVQVEILN